MSKKVLIIIIVVVLLFMGTMGAGFFILWNKISQTVNQTQNNIAIPEEEVKEEKLGPIFSLGTLIVNLSGSGGKRYLRTKIEFELNDEESLESITNKFPLVKDSILIILSGKKYEDISTSEGKVNLREEIMLKLNEIMKEGSVKNIYFTEFVIQ